MNIIASLHSENKCRVIISGNLSHNSKVVNEVRQVSVLTLLLFNIYGIDVLMVVDRELVDRGISIRYRFGRGLFNHVSKLQYTNVIILLGNTVASCRER